MFMGSFPFGGMLGSCRREGMCMLTLISEKGKLIMLIKLAIAYGNKSVTLKHFQKQAVRLAKNISRENKLKQTNLLEFLFNIEGVFLCISLFCLFRLTISI